MANSSKDIFRTLTNKNHPDLTRTVVGKANWMGFNIIETIGEYEVSIEQVQSVIEEYDTGVIEKAIRWFSELDLEHVSEDELENVINLIIPAVIQSSIEFPKGFELYRARNYNLRGANGYVNLFEKSKELWCAPVEFIKQGRLNRTGEQILYTSTDALTPIHEIRSSKEAEFALIKYRIKASQGLNLVMIGYDSLRQNKGRKGISTWSKKANRNMYLINSFIKREFSKKVDYEKSYLYRPTLILKNLFDNPDCQGFVYPSVEKADGMNIAIKPDFVKDGLEFSGLSHWINKSYDKKQLNASDLWCWQAWSEKLAGDRIEYRLSEPCEILFEGLKVAKDKFIPGGGRIKL